MLCDEKLGPVWVDKGQIHQCILNKDHKEDYHKCDCQTKWQDFTK